MKWSSPNLVSEHTAEDRFFSSLYGKSLSGLSFFTLSLVSIQHRHSFPIQIEQTIKTASEKLQELNKNSESCQAQTNKKGQKKTQNSPAQKAESAESKNLGGRPKGSKNKDKTVVTFTPELLRIKGWIQAVLQRITGLVPLTYLLLDGHFGNNNALQMARLNLHLISKLRYDSALYLPYENPETGKKCQRKYGEKLNFSQIPAQFLKSSTVERQIQTEVYQLTVRSFLKKYKRWQFNPLFRTRKQQSVYSKMVRELKGERVFLKTPDGVDRL